MEAISTANEPLEVVLAVQTIDQRPVRAQNAAIQSDLALTPEESVAWNSPQPIWR